MVGVGRPHEAYPRPDRLAGAEAPAPKFDLPFFLPRHRLLSSMPPTQAKTMAADQGSTPLVRALFGGPACWPSAPRRARLKMAAIPGYSSGSAIN